MAAVSTLVAARLLTVTRVVLLVLRLLLVRALVVATFGLLRLGSLGVPRL